MLNQGRSELQPQENPAKNFRRNFPRLKILVRSTNHLGVIVRRVPQHVGTHSAWNSRCRQLATREESGTIRFFAGESGICFTHRASSPAKHLAAPALKTPA